MKDRIKTLMESQHMTQQVFADFLGINPATLSGIFNDRTKPTINIVEAVKKKFPDISLDWLMFGAGSMYQRTGTTEAEAATATPSSPVTPHPSTVNPTPSPSWNPEPTLNFGETTSPTPTTHYPTMGQSHHGGARNVRPDMIRDEVKNFDKPSRRVTEIRVYYDDQTWESFVPAKK